MLKRIHMQDQVHDRIRELMNERSRYNWDDIFQNAATLTLITLFLAVALKW